MADRSTFPVVGVKDNLHLLTAKLTGGGVATDMTNAESENMGAGEISAAAYSATGVFNLTFRKSYPQLKAPVGVVCLGTTTGLVGIFTAWDPAAGTATLKLSVGSVATDPSTDDTIYITWLARNSGRNT